MYRKIMFYAGVLGMVLLIMHLLATMFYWYIVIVGFDKVMHALGGIFLALLGGALFLKQTRGLSSSQVCIILTLFVFIIGLFWEYYEYSIQAIIKSVQLASIPDSIGDLIFDMVGGVMGSYFVILINKSYNKEQ